MRAALGLEHGHYLEVEDVEPRPAGPHDVVVSVGASGVCHTDIAVLEGSIPVPLPMVLGHEGAGTVEEVGSQVTAVRPGDRVIGSIFAICGHCWYCAHGATHLCANSQELTSGGGVARADGTHVPAFSGLGTFAELMTVHEKSVVPVRTDLPDDQLALIGCAVTTGLGAVFNTAGVIPGASVAVIGCGGVGQSVIQGARVAGAARIVGIDPGTNKREAAVRSGASDVVDPAVADPVQVVKDLTDGRGADFTFEVVGRAETIAQSWAAARRGGTVTLVGMPAAGSTISFPGFELATSDKRLCSSLYGGTQALRDFPLIVELAETGRLDLGSMVTRRLPLDDVNDAVRALEAGEEIRSVLV